MIIRLRHIIIFLSVALLLVGASVTTAQDDGVSTTTVHYFSDASEVEDAWSTLSRYEGGVIATLHTSDLTPNEVVTMWWVVFNEPANCSDACGEDDIFVFEDDEMVIDENGPVFNVEQHEAAQISVLGGTGNVIGDNGEGHFSAVLPAGPNPNLLFGATLLNPMTAEIHLVLRAHGPMDPATLDAAIISFNGGCADDFPNEPCEDVQFAVHLPA